MIWEAVLVTILGAITAVLEGVLPEQAAPAALTEAAGGFVPWYTWLDSWAPIHEAFELALLSVQITVIIGGIYALTWVLTKLHVLGGSS